ncbi:hypothetical protein LLJ53_11265 [Pseudomonas aeruginosa]|uniref:hypothetical protein n=1 Tax=Pseudomonas aeruginosa TaxID=287 RepID=UPI0021E37474|nr:hypothetical protein [Pseudomonas aeruginosa]UYF86584.1 hypothetical protein LLJ53_11265 [Pseudomonas aeruginosa]
MSKGRIMLAREKLNKAFIDYVLGFAFYKETKDSHRFLKSIIYPIYITFQVLIIPLLILLLIFSIAMPTSLAIMQFESKLADILLPLYYIAESTYQSEPIYKFYNDNQRVDLVIRRLGAALSFLFVFALLITGALIEAVIYKKSNQTNNKEEHDTN